MHGLAMTDVATALLRAAEGASAAARHAHVRGASPVPTVPTTACACVTTQLIDTGKFESLFANHKKS